MNQTNTMAEQFEAYRGHLRSVAYRMLGSLTEADDAVQEAWIRLSRTDARELENLRSWLTTVTSRVCLDVLRSRKSRREESLELHMPEPIVTREYGVDPEYEALLADSVGLALLVVLDRLAPAERLAFVLHDMFGVPFDNIAPIVGRTTTATRQLASRARRRVQGAPTEPDTGLPRQREVVNAFFAAAREGNFEALVAVLDPDVVLRSDGGKARPATTRVVRGAQAVASQAFTFSGLSPYVRPVLVNGIAGVLVAPNGRPFAVIGFTVRGGKIVAIDALADPERLQSLDVTALGV